MVCVTITIIISVALVFSICQDHPHHLFSVDLGSPCWAPLADQIAWWWGHCARSNIFQTNNDVCNTYYLQRDYVENILKILANSISEQKILVGNLKCTWILKCGLIPLLWHPLFYPQSKVPSRQNSYLTMKLQQDLLKV